MADRKKIIPTEVMIGIFAIAALVLLIFGFNFLKGRNAFGTSRTYYVEYPQTNGVVTSTPVLFNGYNIGTVTNLELNEATRGIVVQIDLREDLNMPRGTEARIVASDLLGSKAISLILPKTSTVGPAFVSGDTLPGAIEPGLTDDIAKQIEPLRAKTEALIESLDTVVRNVNSVFATGELQRTIASVERTVKNVESTTGKLDKLVGSEYQRIDKIIANVEFMTSSLSKNAPLIDRAMKNLASVSDTLAQAQIGAVVIQAKSALSQVSTLLSDINAGRGTLGKLAKDETLYKNLERSSANLDELFKAFKDQPSKYLQVRVSLFGGKIEK